MLEIKKATHDDRWIYFQCLSAPKWRSLYAGFEDIDDIKGIIDSFAPLNSYELDAFILLKDSREVGFVNCFHAAEDIVEIGGGLLPIQKNRGIGVIFYVNLIYYLFFDLHIKSIRTTVLNINVVSKRIHDALGFEIEREDVKQTDYRLTIENFYKRRLKIYDWVLKKKNCEVNSEKR